MARADFPSPRRSGERVQGEGSNAEKFESEFCDEGFWWLRSNPDVLLTFASGFTTLGPSP